MEIYPLSDVQTLMKLEPTMKSLIEDSISKYKAIACKIPFLNEQNLVLKDKQEKMVSFHKEYMQKINQDEIKTRLNKIFNEFNSTVKLINWDELAKANITIWQIGYFTQETIQGIKPIPKKKWKVTSRE